MAVEWWCKDEQPCGHLHRAWISAPEMPEGGAWIYPEDVIIEHRIVAPPGKWAIASTVGGKLQVTVSET